MYQSNIYRDFGQIESKNDGISTDLRRLPLYPSSDRLGLILRGQKVSIAAFIIYDVVVW